MEKGSFLINGINSSDLKSYIQNRPELPVPRRKVSFQDIAGRSGAVPFDEQAYENTTMQIVLYTAASSADEAAYNRAAIYDAFDSGAYVPFTPYFDDTKTYMVHLESMSFLGNNTFAHNQPYTIGLTVKPYKYLTVKNFFINQTLAFQVSNPTLATAEPLITISGTGDCTLVLNGESFVFKNIVGSIIIDCENQFCYKYNGALIVNENAKMFSVDFPVLQKGLNTISFTAGFTVSVDPKWRTLI